MNVSLTPELEKLVNEKVRSGLYQTASEVVRTAIAGYDFERCEPSRDPHRQISVRITADQRSMLKRYARQKDASVGELLRLALEAMPSKGAKKKK